MIIGIIIKMIVYTLIEFSGKKSITARISTAERKALTLTTERVKQPA